MDEIETEERMLFIFDSTINVHSADLACVTPERSGTLDNHKLVLASADVDFVGRRTGDDGEDCAGGFPAFCTTAQVIVCNLRGDFHLDTRFDPLADDGAAGKVSCSRLDASVN